MLVRLLIVSFFFTVHVFSLTSLSYNGMGGISLSRLKGVDVANHDQQRIRVAISTGVLRKWAIVEDLSFQTGLFVTQRGTRKKYYVDDVRMDERITLRYIEWPLLLGYVFPYEYKKMSFVVKHGVVFGYLVDAKKRVLTDRVSSSDSGFESGLHRDMVGLVFSAGVRFLGDRVKTLDFSYHLGLRGTGAGELDVKNSGVDVMLGIEF